MITDWSMLYRAYFKTKPDGPELENKPFIIKNDRVIGWNNGNGKVFVEYYNKEGKATRGWLDASQLIEVDSAYDASEILD